MSISVFIVIIISITGQNNLQLIISILSETNNRWLNKPISDLIIADNTCPFEYEAFIKDKWEGTIQGCICINGDNNKNETSIYRGDCKLNMAGCRTFQKISPMVFNKWRNTILCVKKEKLTYENYLKNSVDSNSTCKNGYKKCGTLDSIGNLLCNLENDECPINKIVIQNRKNSAPQDYPYKELLLKDNETILYFTNKATEKNVVLDVKLSEGLPCLDARHKNTNISINSQFILNTDYYSYPCTNKIENILYDNRYSIMDSYNKSKLYLDNGIFDQIEYYYPYYNVSSLNTDISVYSQPFIGWKLNCLKDSSYNMSLVSFSIEKINELILLKFLITMTSIITFTYANLQIFVKFSIFRRVKSLIGFNFLEFIYICFNFTILILAIVALLNSYNFPKEIVSFNCSDKITNTTFNSLDLMISNNLWYNKAIGILSISNISVYLLYLIVQIISRCFNQRSNNQLNTINNENLNVPLNQILIKETENDSETPIENNHTAQFKSHSS